jgi:phosphoribosylglycinamide formyltransferase-1
MRLRLGFLASHVGSNLQAIIDACSAGRLAAELCVVIGNNSQAQALERARAAGIPTRHLSSHTQPCASTRLT